MSDSSEVSRMKLYQVVTIVVTAVGLLSACGFIPERGPRSPTYPSPPSRPPQTRTTPASLRFPETAMGTISEPLSVRLENVSPGPHDLRSVQIVGEQFSAFHMGRTCSGTVEAKKSCDVLVIFQPRATGIFSAALIVDWEDGESQAVRLTGVGVAGK